MSDFKIIRPFVASDVSLVSSTVSATDPNALGAWASGTTYGLGDVVQVDSPTFTFTASGYVFKAVNHGWPNGTMLQVSSSGTLPPGLSTGVRYYMVSITLDTYKLSLTKNGPPITTTGAGTGTHTATVSSHRLYESQVAGNIGNVPHLNTSGNSPWWLDIGSTNRWKCMDSRTASQTYNADSITYKLQTNGMIDSVYVGNVYADQAIVTARQAGGGAIVYGPNTYSLRKYVATYWDWVFSPIENTPEFTDIDLPAYNGLEIEITLTKTGDTVKVGTLLVGLSRRLGLTSIGCSFSINDFSVKTSDEWGNYTFTERPYSKKATYQVLVDPQDVDMVGQQLAFYRAMPVVFIGTTAYASAIIYGKFNSFTTTVVYDSHSMCALEVEGLT